MTESLADRMQLCKDRYNDIPQCLIDEVRALEAKNAIYKERPRKPYEENKMAESLTGRLINLFNRCDSTIRLDSISLTDEVRVLESENAEYKYTPQAYDEMWKRVKEVVNENDKLKAQLEKSINNQETDSN